MIIPFGNLKRFAAKALLQPAYALKVLSKRMSANLYYTFGQGRSSFPEGVTLFLTHRCNLHCKMCGQWGEIGVAKYEDPELLKGQLSFDALRLLVEEVSAFKPSITLFGGEPLLYDNIIPLIRHIKLNKMHCLMITNGSLLQNQAKEIVDSGLDELNVSLDGDSALHDSIRGVYGLFESVINGLKQVQALRSAGKKKIPLVNLQCTVSRFNYERLECMLEVARVAHADSLTFHNLIFLEPQALEKQGEVDAKLGCSSKAWEGFVGDSGIDPHLLGEKMKKILSGKYPFKVDFYPNFSSASLNDYYKNPCYQPFHYTSRCLSPWLVAYVFPEGQVKPCLNCSYSFGSILKDTFKAAWNSQEAIKFRLLLKENKIFPACVRCTELYRY